MEIQIELFYIYNRGPWQNTETRGPYKGFYSIGDSYNIPSSTNSLESHSEFLSNLGASLKNTPDMSVSITGMMTGDSGDATASDVALKRAEMIKGILVESGASQSQVNVENPVGGQSDNSTQIKINSIFNVPNLPINKSQINNLNQ